MAMPVKRMSARRVSVTEAPETLYVVGRVELVSSYVAPNEKVGVGGRGGATCSRGSSVVTTRLVGRLDASRRMVRVMSEDSGKPSPSGTAKCHNSVDGRLAHVRELMA